jgi:predicted glycosyltransferase involved in capsule biosynthesis
MEQKTNIVIPWRSSGDWWRDRSFEYVLEHMQKYNPIIADDGTKPFSRSGSKNLGAKQCTDDVVLFLDADTVVPHEQIDAAIELARQGYMVHPFSEYHSIPSNYSRQIFINEQKPSPKISNWSIDWATGGAIAMPKDFFFSIGAYDEGYIDWGFEDISLIIVGKKAGVELKRIPGNCYHLWHPREEENENILKNKEKYLSEYMNEEVL